MEVFMAHVRYVITNILVSLTMTGAVPVRAQTPARLPVVATFSILADFARNVGGDRIETAALVGPEATPMSTSQNLPTRKH
jgi:zinc/manganese transport system substrate-binding protein